LFENGPKTDLLIGFEGACPRQVQGKSRDLLSQSAERPDWDKMQQHGAPQIRRLHPICRVGRKTGRAAPQGGRKAPMSRAAQRGLFALRNSSRWNKPPPASIVVYDRLSEFAALPGG
jgi:hypothetical protein